jgi:HEAT repeat protein
VNDLKAAIAQARAVIVCGAGTSIATVPSKRAQLSWRGLLITALEHCAGINKADAKQVARYSEAINSDDFDDMIGAATWIKTKLDGPTGGEFRNWLRQQIGSLEPEHTGVIEALRDLGALLATTNYDGLISHVTGWPAVTWREDNKVERLLNRDATGVLHLHGHWEDSESVILGEQDYGRIVSDEHTQAMQQAMRSVNTLVFVGCGDTTEDPNFGAWLRWSQRVFAGSEYRHYRLELNGKVKETQTKHPSEERIFVVGYGEDHSDLESFLRSLAPASPSKAGGKKTTATPQVHGSVRERNDFKTSMDKRYGVANLQGLYAPGPGYARDDVTLHEIFVMPSLEPIKTSPVERQTNKDSVDDVERFAEYRERFERNEIGTQRQPAQIALHTQMKLFVVGDPGQGKSTLLQHLLLGVLTPWTLEPQLHPCPVYVRLSELEIRNGQSQLLEYAQSTMTGPVGPRIDGGTTKLWLESGVLWLLDGLDEIRDPKARSNLREFIASRQGTHPQDRWVMTSRPGPASSEHPGTEWTVMRLSELDDSQVLEVLRNWANLLRRKEGESQTFEPTAISKTLSEQPGLTRMRRNSLLLTIMVLFFKAKKRLPDDRWEFYSHADEVLRNAWVRHKHSDVMLRSTLPGEYLKALLPVLAFECMKRGVVAIKTGLLQELAQPILLKYGYAGKDLSDEQERLKRAAEDLIGVLVSRGPDTVGFLHLTFQEFHAAQHLLNLADPTSEIALYWDDPDWTEVWNLYVLGGAMREGLLEQLFKTIRAHDHELDQVLFRPELKVLQLAGVGRQPLPNSENWQRVLNWAFAEVEKRTWHETRIQSSLMAWEKVWPDGLIERYLTWLKGSQTAEERGNAAAALVTQASVPTVQQALLEAMQDENRTVRGIAARSLGTQASVSDVQQALLTALEDQNATVRGSAVRALGTQASNPTVQQALLDALKDQNSSVRWSAVDALGTQASDRTVQQALIGVFKDIDADVRENAIRALGTRANISDVQQVLLESLGDENATVRGSAAAALGSQASVPIVQQALLGAFKDFDADVRASTTRVLGTQASDPEVQRVLLEALQDQNSTVRGSAARALGSQANVPNVQQALLKALRDENATVRGSAAAALGMQSSVPDVQRALLEAFKEETAIVRRSAARALSTQASVPDVQQALLGAFEDQDSTVRWNAAQALGSQANVPNVQRALLEALQDDNSTVRWSAARALGSQASLPDVQQALLTALRDDNPTVRESAARALATVAARQRRMALKKNA